MNSNIQFIRRHKIYGEQSYMEREPSVTLPLADLNARIRKGVTDGMRAGLCMGAGLTALLTFIGIMVAGWGAA